MRWAYRRGAWLLVMVCILLAGLAKANKLELGMGLSAIEEGDDRFRPGLAIHAGLARIWYGRAFLYGRDFGPVKERTYILSAGRKLNLFQMFGIKFLRAGLGLALMDEHIEIDIPGDSEHSLTEDNFNFGGTAGIYGSFLPRPFLLQLSVESHVFLAGEAGILLANGRKHIITVTAGMKL